jgi:muconolactone delta-isomerase
VLYLLDVEIDYTSMGDRRTALVAAEHVRVGELMRDGVVVCEWRKASGRGVVAVWDCASHDALREIIAGLPLAPFLSRLDFVPLSEHPLFPGGRPAPRP